MKHQTESYLQFPLYLLSEIFTDKESAINKIISYGIYRYSTKFHYQKSEVAKQLIYDNYRGELSTTLKKQIEALKSDIIGMNDDYSGFTSEGEFNPEDEIGELIKEFEQNEQLYKNSIEHYQIHLAYQSLGITGDKESILKVGKDIELKIPTNEPMPMISKSLLFEFRDKEKAEYEIIQFCAFIAIKSTLGIKSYVKTNKMHIVSRMFGYSSLKHLPTKMPTNIKTLFVKYSHRYHFGNVIEKLELNWNVITYSRYMRGMYVAMENKISMDSLALIAETKKQKNRINELKTLKKEATAKALQQLSKRTTA